MNWEPFAFQLAYLYSSSSTTSEHNHSAIPRVSLRKSLEFWAETVAKATKDRHHILILYLKFRPHNTILISQMQQVFFSMTCYCVWLCASFRSLGLFIYLQI